METFSRTRKQAFLTTFRCYPIVSFIHSLVDVQLITSCPMKIPGALCDIAKLLLSITMIKCPGRWRERYYVQLPTD